MSIEEFDSQVKALVDSGKLSATKIKSITDLAIAHVQEDAHLVSTLFKTHKKAKPANKIWSFYVIDAISREMKSHAKKGKGKESTGKGSSTSFLAKMEICLERIVNENLEKGLPEHREKVKKVLGIWNSSSTFRSDLLSSLLAKANGDGGGSTPTAIVNKAPSQAAPKTKAKPDSAAATALTQDLLSVLTGSRPAAAPVTPPVTIAPDIAQILANALNPNNAASALSSSIPPPPPPLPSATSTANANPAAINLLLQQLASSQQQPRPSATPPQLSPPVQSGNLPPRSNDSYNNRSRPENSDRGWGNRSSRNLSPPRRAFSPEQSSNMGRRSPPTFRDQRSRSRSPPPRRAPLPRRETNNETSGFEVPIAPPQPQSRPQPEPSTKVVTADNGPTYLDAANPGNPPDFTSFDAYDPDSWETFARTWLIMFNFVPSNEQLLMFAQQSMMAQAAAGFAQIGGNNFGDSDTSNDLSASYGASKFGGQQNQQQQFNNASDNYSNKSAFNASGSNGFQAQSNDISGTNPNAAPPAGRKRGRMEQLPGGGYKWVIETD